MNLNSDLECVCVEHLERCCVSAVDEQKFLEEQEFLRVFAPVGQKHLVLDPVFQRKFDEFKYLLTIYYPNDSSIYPLFGPWLIWVGDYELRQKCIQEIAAVEFGGFDSNLYKAFQAVTLLACVNTRSTRCKHSLPKPYEKCECGQWVFPHWRMLLDAIQDLCANELRELSEWARANAQSKK